MGNKFGAFLAGGLAGAVVALLYAPRSGQETRAMVTDKMSAAWGEAQELGSQAGANMQHAYQDAASKGQEVVQDVAATTSFATRSKRRASASPRRWPRTPSRRTTR